MSKLAALGVQICLIIGLISCNRDEPSSVTTRASSDLPAPTSKREQMAQAILISTSGNQVSGIVTFLKVSEGVRVVAEVKGLTPGRHGFHIHEKGDCSGDEASAAGEHYNPTNMKHGSPLDEERHVGDLGNLDADEAGEAFYDRIDKVLEFDGANSFVGRSVVIHATVDDFKSQPSGNSGKRIACGVIERVK